MHKNADNSIAVEAWDKETNSLVSVYESVAQCARNLFIRRTATILYQIERKTEKGIASYKDGKIYFFKKALQNG